MGYVNDGIKDERIVSMLKAGHLTPGTPVKPREGFNAEFGDRAAVIVQVHLSEETVNKDGMMPIIPGVMSAVIKKGVVRYALEGIDGLHGAENFVDAREQVHMHLVVLGEGNGGARVLEVTATEDGLIQRTLGFHALRLPEEGLVRLDDGLVHIEQLEAGKVAPGRLAGFFAKDTDGTLSIAHLAFASGIDDALADRLAKLHSSICMGNKPSAAFLTDLAAVYAMQFEDNVVFVPKLAARSSADNRSAEFMLDPPIIARLASEEPRFASMGTSIACYTELDLLERHPDLKGYDSFAALAFTLDEDGCFHAGDFEFGDEEVNERWASREPVTQDLEPAEETAMEDRRQHSPWYRP